MKTITHFSRFSLAILIALLFTSSIVAQLTKEWEINIPTGISSFPSYSLLSGKYLKTHATPDGGYVTHLFKKSEDGRNSINILKYDQDGNEVWNFEKSDNVEFGDVANVVEVDNEGSIIVGGKYIIEVITDFEFSFTVSNYQVFKISPDGEELWEIIIEQSDPLNKAANQCLDIAIDSENNIYTTGRQSEMVEGDGTFVNKISPDGNLLWNTYLGDGSGRGIITTSEGIKVYKFSADNKLFTIDEDGEIISEIPFGLNNNLNGTLDEFGNYYHYGYTGKYELNKFDGQGNLIWTYNKPTNLPSNVYADQLKDIYLADDGTIYTTGRYYGEHYGDTTLYTNCDILTTHLDANGQVIWENIYNYDGERSCQIGNKITVDENGNTIVVGYQSVPTTGNIFGSKDMVMLIYNPEGERVDSIYHNSSIPDEEDIALNVQVVGQDIYIQGWTTINDETNNTILKYSLKTSTKAPVINNLTIFPNPSEGIFTLSSSSFDENVDLEIIDISGRRIYYKQNVALNSTIDLSHRLSSGMYILQISNDSHAESRKIIIGRG